MRSRSLARALLLFALVPVASANDVRIGVLGLFHPKQLIVSPAQSEPLVVTIDQERFVLESGSPSSAVNITIAGKALRAEINGTIIRASSLDVASRDGAAVNIRLSIPGRLSRSYRGTLTVKSENAELVPVVTMDLETAVASAVQAESAPGTPDEALKAQAVVSRSYYVAGRGRHERFDFCDLTHCQLLRGPPRENSPAALAAAATKGLVLSYQQKPVAAMFTRSCGGKTLTPAQAGLPTNGYPYFSVACDYCRSHPVRWTRKVSREDAELLLKEGEAGRLAVARKLGWNAVPSNDFAAHAEAGEIVLQGKGQGHGIGLCQRGASAMAKTGTHFREILVHYFPNADIVQLPH